MLNADIAVAARGTRFAHLEVLRGIPPLGRSTVRFPRAAGWTDAMRYILTGDEFDADEALRMRLLTEVVEPGEELARALEYAERTPGRAAGGARRAAIGVPGARRGGRCGAVAGQRVAGRVDRQRGRPRGRAGDGAKARAGVQRPLAPLRVDPGRSAPSLLRKPT